MKFKTKQEKRAFRMGCAVGRKSKVKKNSKSHKPTAARVKSHKPTTKPIKPIDVMGDFEYTDKGYIKGGYTVDGFFEPD